MQSDLTIDTLGGLHYGFARAVVNNAIGEALRDIDIRGNDERARNVVITLTLTKLENGPVSAELKAIAKLPDYKVDPTVGTVRQTDTGPVFEFKSDAPEAGATLPFDDDKDE